MSVDWTQYERHSLLVGSQGLPLAGDVTTPADITDGVLMQAAIAGLCLSSVVFSVKTIRSYRRYLDADNIAVESPAMFLLPWLALCDVAVSSMICVALVWPGKSESSIAVAHLPKIQRIINASQICYCLLITMLSVHVMSVAGVIKRKIDMHGGGYYGMAALMISCTLSHPIFANRVTSLLMCFTVIPLTALVAVAAAAACMSRKTHNARQLCVLRLDDSEDIEATVDPGRYIGFSARVAVLFWLHNLPWFIWTHVHPHAYWHILYVVAVLCVCARGELPLALLEASPATSMRPFSANSRAKYHDHQE
ncbi:hypothetical protein IW140_004900 [Coemansia sp. RSA 1813]|nr:hypothetical protein LPJ74_006155 [Coemansia sp. RSA 1843]KAJ2087402.1 hypothetical protein IW138_005019 [Coemansia sp. RSA 986]KAJ2566431.1 hypothetical protein IW140_004900 [Coemansia sp. RSA 1813]